MNRKHSQHSRHSLLPLMAMASAAFSCIGACVGHALALRSPRRELQLLNPSELYSAVPSEVIAYIRRLDHDLRTPIGTVANVVDLLREGGANTPLYDDEALRILDRQVARLTSIADELRDLAVTLQGPGG